MRPPHGFHAEQVLHLIGHEQGSRTEGEADDHGVRNEAREVTEPEQRYRELDRTDHEGHQENCCEALLRIYDHGDCAQHRNRDRVGGAVDELARGIKQCTDSGHDDRGVEPVDRRHLDDHRVGHRLRHGDRRDREPGENVGAGIARPVAAQRVEGRDEAVDACERRCGGVWHR